MTNATSLEQASTPSVEAVADVRVPFGSTLGYCHWRGPVPPAGTELYTHPPIPAPESAKGAEQAAETFGWLIEMTGGPRPLWYTGGDILSADANEAVRFSTRERAIQVFGALRELRPRQSSLNLDYDCYTFTEHAWPRERVGASPSIKVKVRGSNQELSVVGWYGDTVFLASPPTQEGDGARERVSASKEALILVGHLHANGDFCVEQMPHECTRYWPVPLYAASHQAGDRPERQE